MKRFIVGEGKLVESLLGRIALVLLFSAVFSLSFTLLFLINKGVAPIILKFTVVAASALATGLQARGMLKHNTFALRYTVALTATILSLGILKPLTLGFIGIDLFGTFPLDHIEDAVIQLLLSAALIFVAQRAWSRGLRVAAPQPSSPRPRRATTTAAAPIQKKPKLSKATSSARPKILTSNYWRATWAKRKKISLAPISRILQAPRDWSTGNKTRPATKVAKQRKAATPRRSRRKAAELVHLSTVVEHRCPYCLEPVASGDPRGVETCKVCKTKHHKDCWDVTGVCQIPHKHL